MIQLRNALNAIEPIKKICLQADLPVLRAIGEQLNPCPEVRDRISRGLVDDPPATMKNGGVIREGVDPELDELRTIAYKGKDYLRAIQQRESEETSIPSLKIGYNNVFGYYIEVTNTHKDKVQGGS